MESFGRAESPPPESILTNERILDRPPQAPARKRVRTSREVYSPTGSLGIVVPRTMSPTSSVYLPWTSAFRESDQENENGTFNWVLPSWRLYPRRRLFVEDTTPVSTDLLNTLRPISPNDTPTVDGDDRNREQENVAPPQRTIISVPSARQNNERPSRRVFSRDC